MAKEGDRVRVRTKKEEIEGLLMPSLKEDVLVLKLDNGYNIGLEKKKILEMKIIKRQKKREERKRAKGKIKVRKGLPLVSILHCGGTIASKIDYETGAVKAKFSPEEILEMFPELGKIVNLRSRLVANMMSENMRLAHYNLIAKEIEKEIKAGAEGVIVTHGTDTLHYTAAALAFVLENLGVPILLVGAQRSSDRGSSDAFLNLKSAANFIAKGDFGEVGICMHASVEDKASVILPACKSRKMHSSRRDAFKSINVEPWALVKEEGEIKWLRKSYAKKDLEKKLKLRLFKEDLKVGLVKAHPQMFAEELKIFSKFEGLVLEGTGLGHFPTEVYDNKTKEHELIMKEIEKLARKIPAVMTTQTIFGEVDMEVYAPGRKLKEKGVGGNGLDMTPETALIKLAWLLSNYDKKEIKDLWGKNFRGEISNKRIYEEDFLGGIK